MSLQHRARLMTFRSSCVANAKSAVLSVVARHHIVSIASVSVAVKPVGKLDVRNGPVQFDEWGRKITDGLLGPGQAPFFDSTNPSNPLFFRSRPGLRRNQFGGTVGGPLKRRLAGYVSPEWFVFKKIVDRE